MTRPSGESTLAHRSVTARHATSLSDRAITGRVVLLHGTSSSGKSTVARAVQRLSDDPWVHLGIDTFWNAIDERWMEHGPHAAEGFLLDRGRYDRARPCRAETRGRSAFRVGEDARRLV
jgi:chloramphenicol 3-O phosphotransferase